MKKIENKQDYIITNIVEAGLMRPVDAANFIGASQANFMQTFEPQLEVYRYQGVKYFSFLEVFELSLKNDLKFNKKKVEEAKKRRKVVAVERLDQLKEKIIK